MLKGKGVMIKDELKSLFKNKLLLFVIIVILLIPSIYACMFLSSMWDPYGEIGKLPVAVVNQDIPVEYNGKTLAVGDNLAESLKSNDSMDFRMAEKEAASEGLKSGKYYMVITIPENFSENASTMMDETPKKMELQYATNPGYNYISTKLSETAIKEIKANIMSEVTTTYTQAIFASITDNLGLMADSGKALQNGSTALNKGMNDYLDGVSKVDGGIGAVSEGADRLAAGSDQLQNGSQALLFGINTMKNQIDGSFTEENVSQIQNASTSLNTMNDSIQRLNAVVNGDGTAANPGIDALLSAMASGQISPAAMQSQMSVLKSSIYQLAAASGQLLPASSRAMDSLLSGMQNVQKGLGQTISADGQSGVLEGMMNLNSGIEAMNTGIKGADGLQKGITALKSGSAQLVEKGNELKSATTQLNQGITQLADGSDAMAQGVSITDAGIDMFVTPLVTEETQITNVENNGHAMAAYMMSVGLWVGCLAFCLMYPLVAYKDNLKNGIEWFASKAVIVYPMAVIMAVVLYLALHMINGFNPVQTGNTILVSIASAVCFMSIMYFFNALLGKVGSFLMLVFMVLQLAGSAGTYPLEISGSFAQAIHKYVPFTYTVNAFRSAISGGTGIAGEMRILIVLTIVFVLLTIALFIYRAGRIKAGKSVFYRWIEEHGLA